MVVRAARPLGAVLAAGLVLLAIFAGAGARAEGPSPVVVELFTSQGCGACRPADAILAELADRNDVLALSFHVDTWDYAGWVDPYALPEATARQKAYAARAGRTTAYTPEMVVNGAARIAGDDAEAARETVARAARKATSLHPRIEHDEARRLRVSIPAARIDGPATIWLAVIDAEHATRVEGGENQGRTLVERNVVRELRSLGDWRGEALDLRFSTAETEAMRQTGEGCVVLLQLQATGEIVGADTLWFAEL